VLSVCGCLAYDKVVAQRRKERRSSFILCY
jgi:hypothetical protein